MARISAAAAVDAKGQPGEALADLPSDFEQGEIGPDLFRHACLMGLEGMVSKHRESFYRGGRSDHWITELAISLIGAHPTLPHAALLIIGRWSPRADIARVGWECL